MKKKDLFTRQLEQFYFNPALALWRAYETRLVSKIRLKGPVLDVGCGDGSFIDAAFPDIKIDTGIDLNSIDIEAAKPKKIYKNLILGDARELPFKDSMFNTVFSNCVIEHIPGIDKVLRESQRVLKPGGKFIATTLTDEYGSGLFFYRLLKPINLSWANNYVNAKNNRQDHINYFSAIEWERRIKNAGFSKFEYEYYMPFAVQKKWDFIDQIFATGYRGIRLYNLPIWIHNRFGAKPLVKISRKLLDSTYNYRISEKDKHFGAILLIATK